MAEETRTITELESLVTGIDTSEDVVPIVDVSDTNGGLTGTTKKITLDTIMNANKQPMRYSCHLSSYDYQPLNEGYNTIEFPYTLFDPIGMHDNSVNNTRITIKESGYYLVYGFLKMNDNVDVSDRMIQFFVNGASWVGGGGGADLYGRYGQTILAPNHFNAGDYIELKFLRWGGGGASIYNEYAALGVILIALD